MSVLRLNPLSALPVFRQGQCAACEKPVSGSDVAVRIYGDLIHRDCAFFSTRGTVSARTA